MTKSALECALALQIEVAGLPEPECEYQFAWPRRLWRFDMAWPGKMLAVEVEGGVWTRGRHVRGAGFAADCEKYNEAALLGWRVLRVTGEMVQDGRALQYVERGLKGETSWPE